MVIILNYVLLGILLYVLVIPIVEELSTVIVQWLELCKGKLMVKVQELQNEIDDNIPSSSVTNVIGFSIPSEEDYDEDDDE